MLLVVAACTVERDQAATRWEYATIKGVKGVGETSWYWTEPNVTVGALFEPIELARAMQCYVPNPNRYDIFSLFNCVGADGWELVMYLEEGLSHNYIFRCPVM